MSINNAPSKAVMTDLSSPHVSTLSSYSCRATFENHRMKALFIPDGSNVEISV